MFYSARNRDNELVKRFTGFEANFTLGNRWNGPYEREARNTARRANTAKKINQINTAREKYEEIETQINQIAKQRSESLIRKKEIETRLREIQSELSECSAISTTAKDLRDERALLKTEERKGIDNRKDWAAQTNKLKSNLENLKETDLKNSRVRDPRSQSRVRSSPIPIDQSEPEDCSVIPEQHSNYHGHHDIPSGSDTPQADDSLDNPFQGDDYYVQTLSDMPNYTEYQDPPSPSSSMISGNFGYDWEHWNVDESVLGSHSLTEQDREETYTRIDEYIDQLKRS